MKHRINIYGLLFLALVALSCSKGPRVIPRGKMARIYAEMLVTDQWINSTPSVRRMADTSLVYEPILRKYGYGTDDYIKSVEFYMDDPERYSRIFRTASEIIEDQIVELERLKLELSKPKFKLRHYIDIDDFYPFIRKEPYLHFYDSVAVQVDSTKTYRIVSIERSDTLYDRLEMIVKCDSLSVKDSLFKPALPKAADSLSKVGLPRVVDSLVNPSLVNKQEMRVVHPSRVHSKGKPAGNLKHTTEDL